MVTHQIYHKLNLLSEEDFTALINHKDNIINKGKGATIFDEDGSMSLYTETKSNLNNIVRESDYATSKESIVNFQFNIENFIKVYGQPFYPAFKRIQESLIDIGAINPQPYGARTYRHNNVYIPWHKHENRFSLPLSKFWITIMYLHPNWDPKYGGALKVGAIDTEDLLIADCLSNSVVMHNGYYGHGVSKINHGYEGDRDILLIHWRSD